MNSETAPEKVENEIKAEKLKNKLRRQRLIRAEMRKLQKTDHLILTRTSIARTLKRLAKPVHGPAPTFSNDAVNLSHMALERRLQDLIRKAIHCSKHELRRTGTDVGSEVKLLRAADFDLVELVENA